MKGIIVAVGIVAFLVGLSVAPLPTLFLLLAGLITWVSFKLDLIRPTSERLSHHHRRTVRHWLILHLLRDGTVHVIPDDRRVHLEDNEGTCRCQPRVDHFGTAWFVEHHPLSGYGAIRR